jgi:hypothetical protein
MNPTTPTEPRVPKLSVTRPFGILAEYLTPADAMHAAEKMRDAGFTRWDVYSPYPVHGMDDAMGLKNSKVGWFSFFGGVAGFTTGMTMIFYMNGWDYKLIVGGKPLFSPLFAFPVSYELTILLASFGTLFGMLFLNRLPRLYHPLLKSWRFKGVTHDKFYIVIETTDPKYSETQTRALLESTGPNHIEVVED